MPELTPEHFADWNEQMLQRYDPDQAHPHPRGVVRWVEGKRTAAVLSALNAGTQHAVLDVGCGAGALLEKLPGTRYGIDLSPSRIEQARQKLGSAVTLEHGDAEKLPWPDAQFDRVVASSLLSHVRNPDAVVTEIARVTKPGGRVVFSICHEDQIEKYIRWAHTIPLASSIFGLDGAGGQPQVYNIEYHLQRFSPERLKTVVGSRLRYISQSGVPSLFPVHFVATYIK